MPTTVRAGAPPNHDPTIDASVLDGIGGTPLLELRRIVPEGCARILIKLESANPTGSMKDRMALAMGSSGSTFADHGMRWDNSGKNGHYAPISWSN